MAAFPSLLRLIKPLNPVQNLHLSSVPATVHVSTRSSYPAILFSFFLPIPLTGAVRRGFHLLSRAEEPIHYKVNMTGCGKQNEHLSITTVFMQRSVFSGAASFCRCPWAGKTARTRDSKRIFVVSGVEDCSSREEKK